jgi:hypothetical protein
MALTETEKAYLAEAIGIPYPDLVAAELLLVTAAQEVVLKADIARWQVIRGTYGSLNGKKGVVFHPGDERGDIRGRIIRLLDCAETVNAYRNSTAGRILRA